MSDTMLGHAAVKRTRFNQKVAGLGLLRRDDQ